MYLSHFGLKFYPILNDISPDDIFISTAMRELQTRLEHLTELRGIGLVTGDSGAGKTTNCRKMVSCLHSGLHKPLYISLSTGSPLDMYKSIAWKFGLPSGWSRATLYRQIKQEVTRLCTDAKLNPLLIIDEAHHLRNDVIEELRLLTNYAMDSQNRLSLILVGQTELRRRLSMAIHEAFDQRVVVRYHLKGLDRQELDEYIQHLLQRAGTNLPLFDVPAKEAIFQATNGLPRKINLLAHHCLIAAAADKAKTVSAEHVALSLPEVA